MSIKWRQKLRKKANCLDVYLLELSRWSPFIYILQELAGGLLLLGGEVELRGGSRHGVLGHPLIARGAECGGDHWSAQTTGLTRVTGLGSVCRTTGRRHLGFVPLINTAGTECMWGPGSDCLHNCSLSSLAGLRPVPASQGNHSNYLPETPAQPCPAPPLTRLPPFIQWQSVSTKSSLTSDHENQANVLSESLLTKLTITIKPIKFFRTITITHLLSL